LWVFINLAKRIKNGTFIPKPDNKAAVAEIRAGGIRKDQPYLTNIVDGFEGDALKIKGSYNNGRRLINGWKNSGAPWTYELDPDLMYLP
jgi:hypothetical protein